MFGLNLSLCFTTLLLVWGASSLSLGGFGGFGGLGDAAGGVGALKPCFTPDTCKDVVSAQFVIQYRTLLTTFLGQSLAALETAALAVRGALPLDGANYARVTEIISAVAHLKEILQNPKALTDEKLASIILEIQEHWKNIIALSPERALVQPALDILAKAAYTFYQLVLQAWAVGSPIIGVFGSQLTGYADLNAAVLKQKDLSFTPANLALMGEVMSRILQFFGVNKSIVYVYTY